MSVVHHPTPGEASIEAGPPTLTGHLLTELKLATGRDLTGKPPPGARARARARWDPFLSHLWVLRPKPWESGSHGVTAVQQAVPFDWQVPNLIAYHLILVSV